MRLCFHSVSSLAWGNPVLELKAVWYEFFFLLGKIFVISLSHKDQYNSNMNWNFHNSYYHLDFKRLSKGQRGILDTVKKKKKHTFPLLDIDSVLHFPRIVSLLYSLAIYLFKAFYFILFFLHFWNEFLILLTSCEQSHLHAISFFRKWFLFLKLCTSTL